MKKSIPLIVIAIAVFGLLLSCSKKERQTEQTGKDMNTYELNFETGDSLLGKRVAVANLEFGIPKGWLEIPDNVMEMMRKHAAKDTGKLAMAPDYAYSSDNGTVLVVSRFLHPNQPGVKFSNWATEVGQTYSDTRTGHMTDATWITLNKIEALKITTYDLRTVHLKVLVDAKEPVSIDFTIPKDIWDSVKDYIGAALGSVRIADKG